MRKISFLSVLFSLFLISSCQYMNKKTDCCSMKKQGNQQERKSKCKTCETGKKCDKTTYKKCKKKAYKKCGKQACYGKNKVAGFSKVKDLTGGKITGSVFFESTDKYEVKVTANIKGLAPNKKLGFHVHEFGTCENKGLLAGGHLNPWGAKHSGPKAKERHLGDLGNIESDKMGSAVYTVSIKGRLKSFMGRSVIIHAQADDMKSQPIGNSGKRIACGVITASMPPVLEKAPVKKAISPSKKASVKKAVSSSPAEQTQKANTNPVKKTGN